MYFYIPMTFRQILQARAKKNISTKILKKISPYEVILAPMFTEKTHKQQESQNKYTFKIHKDANKNDVKQALLYLYNVQPEHVNIVNVTYKWRNNRKLVRRSYKKAIVTLNKKDKIEIVG